MYDVIVCYRLHVPAEHDSCANDLAELNWHVSFQGGKEGEIERACDNAVALNVKLKEDIEFIKQHM